MSYFRFNTYSMKAKMSWVQKVLGLPVTGLRDKSTVKALTKFQKEHSLVPNGVICERTFNLLYNNGGSKINIKS